MAREPDELKLLSRGSFSTLPRGIREARKSLRLAIDWALGAFFSSPSLSLGLVACKRITVLCSPRPGARYSARSLSRPLCNPKMKDRRGES